MKRDFWGIDGEIWGWNRYIISNFHSLHPPPKIQTFFCFFLITTIFNAQKRFLKNSTAWNRYYSTIRKCTCTYDGTQHNSSTWTLQCSHQIQITSDPVHIGKHGGSAHISSHPMSPTTAMRSRLGSSATRVERHSPKIRLLHLSLSKYSESYHTYLCFWIATLQLCYDVLACLCNHRLENRHFYM